MKTVKKIIDNGNELEKNLQDLGYFPECIEGVLQDNYFFENMESVKIGRFKPRKYIIILENYVNCWSSNHTLIMTDEHNLFDKTFHSYEIYSKQK